MIKKSVITLILMLLNFMAVADSMQGQPAPVFNLKDQNDQAHQLADYQGQWLVLYFYPKDGTSGCTVEANEFKDNYAKLKAMNTEVLGISLDDAESHQKFIAEHDLPFNLLVDSDKVMSRAYGVDGGAAFFSYAKRQTFIVNPDGLIVKHFEEVDPQTHVDNVLEALNELQTDSNNAESNDKTESHDGQVVVTEEINGSPVYGESWPQNETNAYQLANVLASPERYENDNFVISGRITRVCQTMGCWMVLSDGDDFARVDFNNHSFFIPKDSQGPAQVYGHLKLVQDSQEKREHLTAEGAGELAPERYEIVAFSVKL
jgi:Peroxiredoxin